MTHKQSLLTHLTDQPFIVATGVAAFAHSTWTLGTWFAGMQPVVTANLLDGGINGAWVAQSLHLAFWLTPAALIAFALDVGQIATSRDIQRGQRTWAKYATFAVFAVATYYLQWLYLAHHMPVVSMSAGIRPDMLEFVLMMRDLSIWFIPLLLPLSTLLYTFSHADAKQQADASVQSEAPIIRVQLPTVQSVQLPAPPPERNWHIYAPDASEVLTVPGMPVQIEAKKQSGGGGGNATGEIDASLMQLSSGKWQTACICGKHFESDTQLGAKRAASGHQARCTVYKQNSVQNEVMQ
jgi:hypothetical protein